MKKSLPSPKAKELAEVLYHTPQIVRFLFEANVNNNYVVASTLTAAEYPDIGLTPHYGYMILRKEPPFNEPEMFKHVKPEVMDAVASKYDTSRPGPIGKSKAKVRAVARPRNGDLKDAIHRLLDAKAEYEAAVSYATSMGMDEATVKAMAEIMAEQLQ